MREAYSFPSWFLANWSRLGLPTGIILLVLLPSLVVPGNEHLILVVALLPIYMLHQYEEHAHGRFVADVNRTIGHGLPVLTPTAAFWLNIILVWVVFLAVFAVTRYLSPLVIFIPIYATLINAITHIGAAIQTRAYNPGLITAIVLFLPASIYALIETTRTAPDPIVANLIGFGGGVLAHLIIIAWVLFQRQRLLRAARKANPGAYPTAGTGFLPALLAPAHAPATPAEPKVDESEGVDTPVARTPSSGVAADDVVAADGDHDRNGTERNDTDDPVNVVNDGDPQEVVIAPAAAAATVAPDDPVETLTGAADPASRRASPVIAPAGDRTPDRDARTAGEAREARASGPSPAGDAASGDHSNGETAVIPLAAPGEVALIEVSDEPAMVLAEPVDRDEPALAIAGDFAANGDLMADDTTALLPVDEAEPIWPRPGANAAELAPDDPGTEADDQAEAPADEPIAALDSLNLRVLPIDTAAPDLPTDPPLTPDDDAPGAGGYSRPTRR